MRILFSAVLAVLTLGSFAQSYTMIQNGNLTSTNCSGTLYDNGGASGSYSNSSFDNFYITPPNSSNLQLTFTSFQTESCCDRVYVYDYITNNLIASYAGASLPNGGSPILVPSGQARILFRSDGSVRSAGFAMNWSVGGATTAPVASFTSSTSSPALLAPVQFTNTSSNAVSSSWDFGDGSVDSSSSPSHAYQSPGTYTVRLIETNCFGSDTVTNSITVQNASTFSVSPDTLQGTALCGNWYYDTLTIQNTGGGATYYDISIEDRNQQYSFTADFESGLSPWKRSSNAGSGFNSNVVLGGAAEGNGSLQISGYGYSGNALYANIANGNSNYFSTYIKANSSSRSFLELSDLQGTSNYRVVGIYAYFGSLRIYGSYSYTTYTPFSGGWDQVEIRNIDYGTRTFDVYLNGTQLISQMGFATSQAAEIDYLDLSNTTSASTSYDAMRLMTDDGVANLVTADTSGTTAGTRQIPVSLDLSNAQTGQREYLISIRTNASGADSLIEVPAYVNVTGTPVFNSVGSCLQYDTTYVGLALQDSIPIYNSGCDSLDFTSITSTTADLTLASSQLNLAPGDSTYLHFTFNPSASGSYADSIRMLGNLDTVLCFTAGAFNAPAIAFDSTSYQVNSIGCNDSVPFQFYLYNQGSGANLNWSLSTSANITDDFENGVSSVIWKNLNSNRISAGCYQNSGSYSLAMTGTNRSAELNPINLNAGDSITFWARPGGFSGVDCENPDGGEDVFVQYRVVGSTLWNTIGTVYNYNVTAQRYAFAIPVAGQLDLRFYQPSHSGAGYDHFRIDDLNISSSNLGNSFSPSSGQTAANDSVLISGYIDVSGLVSGLYSRSINITSNDPASPDTTLSVQIQVLGSPEAYLANTCLAYDTTYTGASSVDSLLLVNRGCDSLHLTSYSLSGSQYTHGLSPASVAAGDSLWLPVTFSPAAGAVGLHQDTLQIANNDTLLSICLSGYALGAPQAVLDPDSLSITVNTCGDSLSVPVKLSNTGLSGLDYRLVQGRSSSTINVGVMSSGSYFRERNNIYNIVSLMPDVNETYLYSTTTAGLTTDLDTIDVLVIPESNSTFYATQFSSALQTFLNDGGSVVFCYVRQNMSTAYNVMPISNSFSPPSPIAISMPNHPIAAGLPSAGLTWLSATQRAQFTNTAGLQQIIGAAGSDEAVVATQAYGKGQVTLIGYDYYNTNSDIELLLENTIDWTAGLQGPPDFIKVLPDSGAVAAGDSVSLAVSINTAGLQNGTYDYKLNFATNDPANNPLILPIHLVVNGQAEQVIVDSTCLSFASTLQGAQALDTFLLYNEGCDTLDVNSFTASGSDFTLLGLPRYIAPGDTGALQVQFRPLGVGTLTDTLVVTTNDTAFSICVSGIGQGAALPSMDVDTIRYTLNKCKVVGNKRIRIKNLGQGQMNFDLTFGRYSDSSRIYYNTVGANTQHSFSNLPSSADSIKLAIILHGDYDTYWERSTLYLDGSYWQNLYDNNRYYSNDTLYVNITGTQAANLLADGQLTVGLYNRNDVDGGAGSFHQVDLEIVQTVNWVSPLGANAGTIPAQDSVNRTLLFNAATLPVGTHQTTMIINNNSPSDPSYRVPIRFDVVSEPEMVLSDTCAYYTLTKVGDTTSRQITLYNDGCQSLNVSSISSTSGQFKVSPSSANIPVGDSVQVTVNFIPTTVSNFSASLLIISNDTNRTVCLNGQSGAVPIADFSFSDENICIGEVSFDNSNSQYFNTLLWDFGDGNTTNQNNPIHVFTTAGTYRVSLRASNTLGFDTISKLVTVNPLKPNFGISNDTIQLSDTAYFSDSTAGAVTWIWDFGDGTSSTQQNPQHKYSAQGLFTVRLTVIDARSCSRSITKQILVENKIGLEEALLDQALSVYPNPNTGRFMLEYDQGNLADLSFGILDAQGRLIKRFKGQPGEKQAVELELPAGTYLLQINRSGATVGQRRLIILKQ